MVESREDLYGRVDAEMANSEQLAARLDAEIADRTRLTGRIDAEVASREALSHEVALISIFLEEARKRLPGAFNEKHLAANADEEKHALDALYVSFEDTFRGARADIKERSRVYLPFFQNSKIGSREMPILDVGCGRGEWLELLLENKLVARGIDTNRILLEYCREAGLDVEESDILVHLKNQPDRSLGAVTGFHIIEHLPFDILIQVFDETIRTLRPGGIAIFETPNPQNVLVGSNNFYMDFTHRRPLPSLTTQFLLEARGLCDVQVLNLHPYPDSLKLQDDRSEVAKRFNDYFYGPQDYAVIGRKA
jgi:O-antigen chain-terminating methyltransferase